MSYRFVFMRHPRRQDSGGLLVMWSGRNHLRTSGQGVNMLQVVKRWTCLCQRFCECTSEKTSITSEVITSLAGNEKCLLKKVIVRRIECWPKTHINYVLEGPLKPKRDSRNVFCVKHTGSCLYMSCYYMM